MGEYFVRTIADEDVRGGQPAALCDSCFQDICIGTWIQAQLVADFLGHCRHCSRRWPVRILVGVELDQIADLRLFTGGVWGQTTDDRAPEFAHKELTCCVV